MPPCGCFDAKGRLTLAVCRLPNASVWEHLHLADAFAAAGFIKRALLPGGRFRVAVPDGRRPPSPASYADDIRFGHRVRFNVDSLSAVLAAAGLTPDPVEWHDDAGRVHVNPSYVDVVALGGVWWLHVFLRPPPAARVCRWSDSDGVIRRSSRHDHRGAVSVIVDGVCCSRHVRHGYSAPPDLPSPHLPPFPAPTSLAHSAPLPTPPWQLQTAVPWFALDNGLHDCLSLYARGLHAHWRGSHVAAALWYHKALAHTAQHCWFVRASANVAAGVLNAQLGRHAAAAVRLYDGATLLRNASSLAAAVPVPERLHAHVADTAACAWLNLGMCLATATSLQHVDTLTAVRNAGILGVARPDAAGAVARFLGAHGHHHAAAAAALLAAGDQPTDAVLLTGLSRALDGARGGPSVPPALPVPTSGSDTLCAAAPRPAGSPLRSAACVRDGDTLPSGASSLLVFDAELTPVDGFVPSRAALGHLHGPPHTDRPLVVFVTLVLNGMPFLRHHLSMMLALPGNVDWLWVVVEGVAQRRAHAHRPYAVGPLSAFHRNGLSTDGTTQYLDQVAASLPANVLVVRHPVPGGLWRDKLTMMNAATRAVQAPCVLVQLDADEVWTAGQVVDALALFTAHPERPCAMFDCHFVVGDWERGAVHVTDTRGSYSHADSHEWMRMWRFQPGWLWADHAPPTLLHRVPDGGWAAVQPSQCFSHATTAAHGLVFTHFAYATRPQVEQKQAFYGYSGAVEGWGRLVAAAGTPNIRLHQFFPWADAATVLVPPALRSIGANVPLAAPDFTPAAAVARFAASVRNLTAGAGLPPLRVVVDLVAFQLKPHGGIARMWQQTLPHVVAHVCAARPGSTIALLTRSIVVGHQATRLDDTLRAAVQHAPCYVLLRHVPPYPHRPATSALAADDTMLSRVCRLLQAHVFVSTWYTRWVSTFL